MRLRNSNTETVVHVEGDLADEFRSAGWVDADEKAEKPAPKRRPSSKKAD